MKLYRNDYLLRVVCIYISLCLIFPQGFIQSTYALTSGPSQPEFSSFTPIGTSDMVDLSSGNFNYNIPIMDVGGYPLNLAYDSGVTMDQEASWVGLGWNLNVGQIARSVRGLPDDFNGDKMIYENNYKKNRTVGAHFGLGLSIFGTGELGTTKVEGAESVGSVNFGLGVEYNNYSGMSFTPSIGVSYKLAENASVGMNLSGSVANGPTITPNVSLSKRSESELFNSINGSVGLSINSRKALTNLNLSTSLGANGKANDKGVVSPSLGGSFSFNDNMLFTPTKRTSTLTDNFTFNAAIGGTAFGFSGQVKVTGYGSTQYIHPSEKHKETSAYGYEFTEKNEASNLGVLDFNREKDGSFNKNTTILPLTNYTYDMYSINGQGISGSFRPYRGQVGFVNDVTVEDNGTGGSLGIETEGGWIFAVGVDIEVSDTYSKTGLWKNRNDALRVFKDGKKTANSLDYEKVYFRNSGELNVDKEGEAFYKNKLGAEAPINLILSGGRYKRQVNPNYSILGVTNTNRISGKLQRTDRLLRNQSINKITVEEVENYDKGKFFKLAKPHLTQPHHTAGYTVLQPDGNAYVYGHATYNTKKREVTFAVANNSCTSQGLVDYSGNDNTINNRREVDRYFNAIETPAYATNYLLTSVLSSDYEDKTGNGPTDDDFGSYTKFSYDNSYKYRWRVPFQKNKATLNKGLYSHDKDQKANYVYGEREQVYINKIETKTHIALFTLSHRKDGYGVLDENGGGYDNENKKLGAPVKKIEKIELFSKKDYEDSMKRGETPTPIKTAHFVYDYSQCKGIVNNVVNFVPSVNVNDSLLADELSNTGGKLTLKKVYFTYEKSGMGAYMPYEFSYGELDTDGDGVFDAVSNPNYDMKAYDIWGNYKENKGTCNLDSENPSNAEFPYTLQGEQLDADKNTIAWTLTSIKLPSGGKMAMQYESDDYQYVQDKKVMQLYKVIGAGATSTPTSNQAKLTKLYDRTNDARYLYVELPEYINNTNVEKLYEDIIDEPIYFKFLTRMTRNSDQYDFVSGYFNIDNRRDIIFNDLGSLKVLAVPMKFVKLDGKSANRSVNPISKAGMFFGRSKMNNIVYSVGGNHENKDFVSIVEDLVGSIGTLFDIGKGPNKTLREKKCADRFKANKSWIRLQIPSKRKLGGGTRVKQLQMSDNWDIMTNNPDNPLYKKFYGQIYSYDNEDGTTSGVATFEPNGSRENPFVNPIYSKKPSGADKVLAPMESNYVEKPIGESFFPAPRVTYGRVTVQNLPYTNENGDKIINKHATGKVVNTFYTSYDYPTKTKYTQLDRHSLKYDKTGALGSFFNFSVKNNVTASQGFVIENNDMNAKPKGQWVYAENAISPISGMEYKYSENEDGTLNNLVNTIDETGKRDHKLIGVNYDVVNDFRESYSSETTIGVNTNVAGFLAFIFPVIVPLPLPKYNSHENILRTAVTTKVIEKKGLLKEKIAYDVGASVSTENLAWDANTGEVIVTKTINEYDDAYYNVNYPAYWNYKGMGSATKNLGVKGALNMVSNGVFTLVNANANDYLLPGDELDVQYLKTETKTLGILPVITRSIEREKLWVFKIYDNKISLIDKDGKLFRDCDETGQRRTQFSDFKFKVMRSGYRNLQKASMASITTKTNPIIEDDGTTYRDRLLAYEAINPNVSKIINASAVEYSDYWKPVNEEASKYFVETTEVYNNETGEYTNTELNKVLDKYNINPFIYNIKGSWKAKRSWAYLTGRHKSASINTKEDGYFTSFTPFYKYNTTTKNWEINSEAKDQNAVNKWTFASEVTQYSPFGVELENKDALNRYSSAQYGYKYTLPTAVASNTAYKEIGYDGFEDYEISNEKPSHFSFSDSHGINAYSALSNEEAHTGRKSIEVGPNSSIALIKNLVDVNPKEEVDCVTEDPCPPINSAADDRDGDGIHNNCDNCPDIGNPDQNDVCSGVETDIEVIVELGNDCQRLFEFNITGNPNETVTYYVNDVRHVVTLNQNGFKTVTHTSNFIRNPECNNPVNTGGTIGDKNVMVVKDANGIVVFNFNRIIPCGLECVE